MDKQGSLGTAPLVCRYRWSEWHYQIARRIGLTQADIVLVGERARFVAPAARGRAPWPGHSAEPDAGADGATAQSTIGLARIAKGGNCPRLCRPLYAGHA